MALDLVLNSASELENFQGIMLDGIPRTVSQIEMLAEQMDLSQSYVVNCTLREDINMEKLMGRRVCTGCGEGYNICSIDKDNYFMSPLNSKDGVNCDKCGSHLEARADDTYDIINKRLEIYKEKTEPILLKFDELNVTKINFEAYKGVDEFPRLLELVRNSFPCFHE